MFHKIVYDNYPSYVTELKPTTNQRQNYNLRRTNKNFTHPRCRLAKYQKSFFPYATYLWNSLEASLQDIPDYDDFKIKLELNLPTENPLFQLGNRHTTILMARLRMNCSGLKSNLFRINVLDSPRCSCGHESEDTFHFFFTCNMSSICQCQGCSPQQNSSPCTLHPEDPTPWQRYLKAWSH